MIISRTPYRISFFGGGTDYPAWFETHGGSVLATTIDKYCYLTCRYLPPFFEHRYRVVYSQIEACQNIDDINHPAVREILKYLLFDRGLEIHHDGDLPARSGVGSSSSFTVGLLNALYALQGQMVDKRKLAMESIHVEQEILNEVVGCQDQVLASYGGFNHITFSQNREFSVTPLTIPDGRVEELNDHLLLFYTGISRTASEIAGSFVNDMESKDAQLQYLADLVKEGISVLNSGVDISCFGTMLHDAWSKKQDLGSKVTNGMVDQIYEGARGAGAIGGKLLGAGGGGFMLIFAPPADHAKIRDRLSSLINVPFRFESAGSQIIFFDKEVDYSSEDKLRSTQVLEVFQELT